MQPALRYALALGFALTGCGDQGRADLTTYSGTGFSIGVPTNWEACARGGEEPVGDSLEAAGPPGAQEFPPVIQVSNLGKERAFGHAVRFQELLLSFSPGYREISQEPADVTGATEAVAIRFDQRYPAPGRGEAEVPVTGLMVLAGAPGGDIVSMTTISHADDADRFAPTFDSVLESLEVGGGDTQGSPVDGLESC
jgi:hypothetical protein